MEIGSCEKPGPKPLLGSSSAATVTLCILMLFIVSRIHKLRSKLGISMRKSHKRVTALYIPRRSLLHCLVLKIACFALPKSDKGPTPSDYYLFNWPRLFNTHFKSCFNPGSHKRLMVRLKVCTLADKRKKVVCRCRSLAFRM